MSFLRQINPENGRYSFQKIPGGLELPYLVELQKRSYESFVKHGIKQTFKELSPIEDFTGNLVLEFLEHTMDVPTNTVEECRDRDSTYTRPLRVRVRLITKEGGDIKEVKEQDIFMGDIPAMTDKGTFVINGAERVVVSQLVRSPGIYYTEEMQVTGRKNFGCTIIPNRGAWLEFVSNNDGILTVSIDKARKIPATILLRALGFGTDEELRELFNHDPVLEPTLAKDSTESQEEALIEIYRKQRPGDPPSAESATQLINSLFFNPKRYNMSEVGRYKLSRKIGRLIACAESGTVVKPGVLQDPETGDDIVYPEVLEIDDVVSAFRFLLALMKRQNIEISGEDELLKEGIAMTHEDGLYWLTPIDESHYEVPVRVDDIDHLGNRRIRAVGELLRNQFRVGLLRLERVVRERMTVQDLESVTPQALINIRPVVAAVKEFFGSSQLSQFMDQTNCLSELTHKRRLSALGPGGLSRERAGFEVRDVHYSHYGRICPIETPEGPNIGLIGSLASYSQVNHFGFMETPYRRVLRLAKSDVKKGSKVLCKAGETFTRRQLLQWVDQGIKEDSLDYELFVSDELDYLSADEEDNFVIAQANTVLDERKRIVNERVVVRAKHESQIVDREDIDYVDVSPRQIVSVATALIPFLEHDDANRALMGANMQRQAVPLVSPEAPFVGTGIEYRAAKDSGALIVSDVNGVVSYASAEEIRIKTDKGVTREFVLSKFQRSNAGTAINHRPCVWPGEKIEVGQVLADGLSSVNGELALGRNLTVAFMPCDGYNYEDAILLSEELVRNDVFTSIHIEEYECEARDTKLGPEEVTRDIPQVSEEALRDLDDRGIIRVGAEVETDDILVGKVTPKGETELTAEERLLRAIFGEKARDVRDTSLKVPHGGKGKVIDVKVFSREDTEELSPGVNQLVRVYVAQRRKILQGDKMAGRHGNKGVISKIMPIEDMPYLPDGTPVQIVLNPLGVPSRMNIGQLLETHLGQAAHLLSDDKNDPIRVECPVFDSAREHEINELMTMARLKRSLSLKGLELTTKELDFILYEADQVPRITAYLNSFGEVVVTKAEVAEIIEAGGKTVQNLLKHAKSESSNPKMLPSVDELAVVVQNTTYRERLDKVLETWPEPLSDENRDKIVQYMLDFMSMPSDYKNVVFDGKTGEAYDRPVAVGQIYMLKLAHLVDDKIHARSTGPYSLITQQPLGGKAQFGGQRFGEMEVWALEAYGAAYTLQELLTVKSDDVVGRVKTYEAIVKGENVMEPGLPESFNVLIKELQSLCLDVGFVNANTGGFKELELKAKAASDIKSSARELGLELSPEALSGLNV